MIHSEVILSIPPPMFLTSGEVTYFCLCVHGILDKSLCPNKGYTLEDKLFMVNIFSVIICLCPGDRNKSETWDFVRIRVGISNRTFHHNHMTLSLSIPLIDASVFF